ncbi:MAG: nitrogen fixation protein NifM [Betaproteobacteria bacterium]|nr:nitrogen fixation protein NifM [Betaproteobacteria bacterium]
MSEPNAVAYLVLKTAQNLYSRNPQELKPDEHERVMRMVGRQYELEERILATPEAHEVVVPEATLQAALAEIAGRYPDEVDFFNDLNDNGLSREGFISALEREIKVDAILEKVGARAAKVSDIDVDLYYHYHPEQFQRPETRRARHILVTVNDSIADNTREAALARIDAIAQRLAKEPKRFEEQALKHSECPTALHGGLLGEVKRGQLYPELDEALFAMQPGQVSGVIESSLGFHVLFCEAITPAGTLPIALVRDAVRARLESRRKKICQKVWLAGLS